MSKIVVNFETGVDVKIIESDLEKAIENGVVVLPKVGDTKKLKASIIANVRDTWVIQNGINHIFTNYGKYKEVTIPGIATYYIKILEDDNKDPYSLSIYYKNTRNQIISLEISATMFPVIKEIHVGNDDVIDKICSGNMRFNLNQKGYEHVEVQPWEVMDKLKEEGVLSFSKTVSTKGLQTFFSYYDVKVNNFGTLVHIETAGGDNLSTLYTIDIPEDKNSLSRIYTLMYSLHEKRYLAVEILPLFPELIKTISEVHDKLIKSAELRNTKIKQKSKKKEVH